MDGIGDAIRKIRREVELALRDGASMPDGVRLEPERVTLTLSLPSIQHDSVNGSLPTSFSGTQANRSDGANRLTIEFLVGNQRTASETGSKTAATQPDLSPEERRKLILETGTTVFGAQGFDNSARAEVFCELVAEMKEDDVQAALASIEAGIHPMTDSLARPVARMRQILGFSPMGREHAAGHLLRLFRRCALQEVVSTLGDAWRFGTHWPLPPKN